jgi:hypothetical protein
MVQQIIGFSKQNWLKGECGQHSLIHALLLLGIPISLDEAHIHTVPQCITAVSGTSEEKIINALKHYKCKPVEIYVDSPSKMKSEIDKNLDAGYPIIISVEGYNHWAVLAGRSGNDYVWIDSNSDAIIGVCDWEEVEDWFDNTEYYGIAIGPKNEKLMRYSIVSRIVKIQKILKKNKTLREYWGYYLEDLIEVFGRKADAGDISAKLFFKKYRKKMHETVCKWYVDAKDYDVYWELDNYQRVAEAYNLRLPADRENIALIEFSIALSLVSVFG